MMKLLLLLMPAELQHPAQPAMMKLVRFLHLVTQALMSRDRMYLPCRLQL